MGFYLWSVSRYMRPVLYGLVSAGTLCLLAMSMVACTLEDRAELQNEQKSQEASLLNTLTEEERQEDWQLLFNGENFEGWTGVGRDRVPPGHWVIEGNAIKKVESSRVTAPDGRSLEGGDLMTKSTYRNFELVFDWKIRSGSNSGVKYNVSEEMSEGHGAIGFEYQVIDGKGHPEVDNGDSTSMAGALYALLPPRGRVVRSVGRWNRARIVFCGTHGEHWLNGKKIVEYNLGTPQMDSLLGASKYADISRFAEKRKGHIVLQDHGDTAWYRNVKIRRLPAARCGDVSRDS